jgi:hypothetical protein
MIWGLHTGLWSAKGTHGTPYETMIGLGPGQHFSLQNVQSWIGAYHHMNIIYCSVFTPLYDWYL